MKKIMFLFILLNAPLVYGQNNAIFYGGSGDGWSKNSFLQSSNTTLNHGGVGDGWHANSSLQASNTTLNHGGGGDGWSAVNYLQASNTTMNHGGVGDGYSLNNFMPNVITPSYFGSDGDGWAKNNHLPVLNQILYKGGEGDGWASNVIPLGPLPVTLLSFNGKDINGTHLLDWTTSMEINSSHFVVEHAVDASLYRELGMVNAAGNSSTERNYSFVNAKPVMGNNYYRLKMVDIDQKYKYSNVILLKLLKDHTSMMVYPNPTANYLNVEINGMALGTPLQIEVLDAGGKILKFETIHVNQQAYSLDVSAYANGLYFLKIKGDSFAELVKFSISK
ncbi:MAG: T9SS type A sorting domain-containing protein [Bacteroidetes bacterium]|nr:T9SS type A sorting domain-containing protein [Bacteroidota bacterium]